LENEKGRPRLEQENGDRDWKMEKGDRELKMEKGDRDWERATAIGKGRPRGSPLRLPQ
jgi:hypothetical protein